MEYRKIMNLLDNAPNKPCKFRTKNWVQINDESCGMYSTNRQIKFKYSMLKSNLCDDSDAHRFVKGTITVPNKPTAAVSNNKEKM